MAPAICHEVTVEVAGYTGMSAPAKAAIASGSSSTPSGRRRHCGWASCRLPRKLEIWPAKSPRLPGRSSRSRHFWLKKVSES